MKHTRQVWDGKDPDAEPPHPLPVGVRIVTLQAHGWAQQPGSSTELQCPAFSLGFRYRGMITNSVSSPSPQPGGQAGSKLQPSNHAGGLSGDPSAY